MMFDLTPQAAYWLGAILTDGSLCDRKRQRVVSISVIDRDFIDAVNDACYSMVGRRYAVIPIAPRGKQKQTQYLLQMSHRRLHDWMFDVSHDKKRIPAVLFGAPLDIQKHFLAGVMDGDGWVAFNWRPTVKRVSISSFAQVGVASTDPWLTDLKRLLDIMGIPAKGPVLMKRNNPNWRPIYRLTLPVKPFLEANIPMRIRRKADRLEGLRRYSESSEAICLDCA